MLYFLFLYFIYINQIHTQMVFGCLIHCIARDSILKIISEKLLNLCTHPTTYDTVNLSDSGNNV